MKHTFLVLAALTLPALADQRGDTPGSQPSTPQEQLAKFHVPPGFEVQLVAAEPEIQKPINLNFDAAGRLWTTGSELYPWPASTDANGALIPNFDKGWQGLVDSFKVGDKAPQPSPVGRDTVHILGDFGPDGHARKITLFADKLNIPSGIQPLPQGSAAITTVYGLPSPFDPNPEMAKRGPVAERHIGKFPKGDTAIVYSIPNIWLMSDWDGDGFAEKREPLYTGFGYTDTHGGSSSYIYWIDGWIYGTHGFKNHSEVRDRNGKVTVVDSGNTCRFRPDGTAFEIYAYGQTNPFGLAFDSLGNLFSADSHSKPVYMLLRGGYYEGIGKNHDGLGFAPRITDDDHGSSAIAGIAFYADDKWPEEYRGNLFNGNPVTQRINRDRLEWHGSTPKAIRMPDFLTCDDPWFRPVNLKLGPDGALYIADFYNPIIGHYEVPLTHPSRDHTHGRIWRVVYRGENASVSATAGASAPAPGSAGLRPAGDGILPSRTSQDAGPAEAALLQEVRRDETSRPTSQRLALPRAPDLTQLDAAGLVEKLADPSLEVRRLATNELVDRIGKEAVSRIETIFRTAPTGELMPGLSSRSGRRKGSPIPVRAFVEPSTRIAHGIWALERLVGLDDHHLFDTSCNHRSGFATESTANSPEVQCAALSVIAERSQWSALRTIVNNALERSCPAAQSHALLAMASHPVAGIGRLDTLIWKSDRTGDAASGDSLLHYASNRALKAGLELPESKAFLEYMVLSNWRAGDSLIATCLTIPRPDVAEFLLSDLERTKLETPRAGECLKHAALNLPAEKFGAVVELVAKVGNVPLPRRVALADGITQAARQRKIALPEEITAWSQNAMIEALASSDEGLARQGVDAVRDVKIEAKLEPLAKIAGDEKRPEALRIAALESAANLPTSRSLLAATLADPRHFKLRKRASELLAPGGTAEIIAALPTAPFDLAQSMAGDLIEKGNDGCDALLDLIEAGKASPRLLRNRAIEALLEKLDKSLQARAAALTRDLPPEDERIGKVIAQRAKDFAAAKPDAVHGAQVFQQTCAVCHRFRNVGGNVGPNLDGVITRGPTRLIEDILDPNRNVDPGFRQTIIETNDGQMFAGANVREQSDAVLITDASGKDVTVSKDTIKTRTQSPLSLMPPAFETQLAPADLNDLLAFLLSEAK